MNKCFKILLVYLLFITCAYTDEKTDKEIEIGVYPADLKLLGNFKEINDAPNGLFPQTADEFHEKANISQREFVKIFIKQKGLLEKYPDRVMLGMAHFEFFYMLQLKKNKKSLNTFIEKYPNIDLETKNNVQKIYGLNKVRKTMRKAVGLSLEDDIQQVLVTYYTLFKLLTQAETETIKLQGDDKKNRKLHNNISKNIGKLKTISEKKFENRLTNKKFYKEYSKIYKKLSNQLKKANYIKDYELLTSFIVEIDQYKDDKPSQLLSGLKIVEFILKNIKSNKIKKKYVQDLSNADFNMFSQNELIALGNITKSIKTNKKNASNDIQLQILNLENDGMPVNRFLDVYRNELNVKLESINLQVASASTMNDWSLGDWANAWKNPIPTKIMDESGLEVSLSTKDIISIKAQLAMQNFKELINIEEFRELINNVSEFQDIEKFLNLNSDFDFSFNLDDFAAHFGAHYNMDINNYADLTDLANAQHNANWSVEEYSAAYQDNVDIINALKSGKINSFNAGELARAASSSMQEVADTIRIAASAGVSVDLEATAQGLGFGSFADAVAAYNAQYGTNYTEDEAKEKLGQQ